MPAFTARSSTSPSLENPAFFDMLEAKVRDFYFTQPEDEDAAVQEDSEKPEAEE